MPIPAKPGFSILARTVSGDNSDHLLHTATRVSAPTLITPTIAKHFTGNTVPRRTKCLHGMDVGFCSACIPPVRPLRTATRQKRINPVNTSAPILKPHESLLKSEWPPAWYRKQERVRTSESARSIFRKEPRSWSTPKEITVAYNGSLVSKAYPYTFNQPDTCPHGLQTKPEGEAPFHHL